MSGTLQPRQTAPGAWKRWLKEGARLGGRVWMSLLALSLLVGLSGGWVAHQLMFLGFVGCITAFGLWQAMLLHTAERAAAGKRVTVGDALDGLLGFWRLPGHQAQYQLRVRLICCLICYALFMLVFVAPLLWFLHTNPDVLQELSQQRNGSKVLGVWDHVFFMARGWALVFFWSWINQRGSILASTSMLVRRYGMEWDLAHALWERAVRLNAHNLKPLYGVFFVLLLGMFLVPVLVFPLEVMWVCVVTVAARDMFEQEEALAPQEARVSVGGLAGA